MPFTTISGTLHTQNRLLARSLAFKMLALINKATSTHSSRRERDSRNQQRATQSVKKGNGWATFSFGAICLLGVELEFRGRKTYEMENESVARHRDPSAV
jgi:hypothetical protein